jgi:hypothetical protein
MVSCGVAVALISSFLEVGSEDAAAACGILQVLGDQPTDAGPLCAAQLCRPTSVSGVRPQALRPHHLGFTQPRALGREVSDEFAVPLCRGHHRAVASLSRRARVVAARPALSRSRLPAGSGKRRADWARGGLHDRQYLRRQHRQLVCAIKAPVPVRTRDGLAPLHLHCRRRCWRCHAIGPLVYGRSAFSSQPKVVLVPDRPLRQKTDRLAHIMRSDGTSLRFV